MLHPPDVLSDTFLASDEVFDVHGTEELQIRELPEDGVMPENPTVLLVVVQLIPYTTVLDIRIQERLRRETPLSASVLPAEVGSYPPRRGSDCCYYGLQVS